MIKRLYYLMIVLCLCMAAKNTPAADTHWESLLSGFNVGIGGTIITNEYKDMHGDVTMLPLIGYEGEYLYLRGVAGGIHFFRRDWVELNAQISYLPQHFYAGDSDDWAIRQLDDRYSSLMGGFNGRLILPFGIIGATFSTDLLGINNGLLLDASYTLPLGNEKFNLAPTVGFQWTDDNYNRYYYGVDHGEARNSGLEYYNPSSSLSPYAQLGAKLNFTEDWSAYASVRVLLLNEEIYNSPMVEGSAKYSFSLGAMYSF